MSPSSVESKSAKNPTHLLIAYWTFFLVQTFDCFLFLTLSPHLFKISSVLTGPTRFFIRSNALTLFPFVLLVFSLRRHHVSTEVGKTVLRSFVMFHAGVLAFVGWCVFSGWWYLDPVMGVVGFHGSWLASGLVAMVGYGSIEA